MVWFLVKLNLPGQQYDIVNLAELINDEPFTNVLLNNQVRFRRGSYIRSGRAIMGSENRAFVEEVLNRHINKMMAAMNPQISETSIQGDFAGANNGRCVAQGGAAVEQTPNETQHVQADDNANGSPEWLIVQFMQNERNVTHMIVQLKNLIWIGKVGDPVGQPYVLYEAKLFMVTIIYNCNTEAQALEQLTDFKIKCFIAVDYFGTVRVPVGDDDFWILVQNSDGYNELYTIYHSSETQGNPDNSLQPNVVYIQKRNTLYMSLVLMKSKSFQCVEAYLNRIKEMWITDPSALNRLSVSKHLVETLQQINSQPVPTVPPASNEVVVQSEPTVPPEVDAPGTVGNTKFELPNVLLPFHLAFKRPQTLFKSTNSPPELGNRPEYKMLIENYKTWSADKVLPTQTSAHMQLKNYVDVANRSQMRHLACSPTLTMIPNADLNPLQSTNDESAPDVSIIPSHNIELNTQVGSQAAACRNEPLSLRKNLDSLPHTNAKIVNIFQGSFETYAKNTSPKYAKMARTKPKPFYRKNKNLNSKKFTKQQTSTTLTKPDIAQNVQKSAAVGTASIDTSSQALIQQLRKRDITVISLSQSQNNMAKSRNALSTSAAPLQNGSASNKVIIQVPNAGAISNNILSSTKKPDATIKVASKLASGFKIKMLKPTYPIMPSTQLQFNKLSVDNKNHSNSIAQTKIDLNVANTQRPQQPQVMMCDKCVTPSITSAIKLSHVRINERIVKLSNAVPLSLPLPASIKAVKLREVLTFPKKVDDDGQPGA